VKKESANKKNKRKISSSESEFGSDSDSSKEVIGKHQSISRGGVPSILRNAVESVSSIKVTPNAKAFTPSKKTPNKSNSSIGKRNKPNKRVINDSDSKDSSLSCISSDSDEDI